MPFSPQDLTMLSHQVCACMAQQHPLCGTGSCAAVYGEEGLVRWLAKGACLALEGERAMVHIVATAAAILIAGV